MSSDNKPIDNKPAENRQRPIDTDVEKMRQAALERRRASGITGATPWTKGYEKYIPPGFKGQFVDPGLGNFDQELYPRGWDYAKDENGNSIYAICNKNTNSSSHKFPLMIAPKEVVEAEQAAVCRDNAERLDIDKLQENLNVPMAKNYKRDPFFSDIQTVEDHER